VKREEKEIPEVVIPLRNAIRGIIARAQFEAYQRRLYAAYAEAHKGVAKAD
jgi:hypothetical protein